MKKVFLTIATWAAMSALNTAMAEKATDESVGNTTEAYSRATYEDDEHGYTGDPSENVQAIMNDITDDHDGILLTVGEDGTISASVGASGQMEDGIMVTDNLDEAMAALAPDTSSDTETEQANTGVAAGDDDANTAKEEV